MVTIPHDHRISLSFVCVVRAIVTKGDENSQGHLGKYLQRQCQGRFYLKEQQNKEQLTVERTESIISCCWLAWKARTMMDCDEEIFL